MCSEFALWSDCCQEPYVLPPDDMGHVGVRQSPHQAQQQRQHFLFIIQEKNTFKQYQIQTLFFIMCLFILIPISYCIKTVATLLISSSLCRIDIRQ